MANRLHTNLPSPTRTVFKFTVISFCVAVLVDCDHLVCGRGLQHEPVVLLVGCAVFMGLAFGSRCFQFWLLGKRND